MQRQHWDNLGKTLTRIESGIKAGFYKPFQELFFIKFENKLL
jgi:hypothetical protein